MKYAKIPYLYRPVSRLVMGSIPLSEDNRDGAYELMDAFVAAGGNTIDLATVYGPGRYRLIGDYLRNRGRDCLMLFDKGCHHSDVRRVTREAMAEDIASNQANLGWDHTEFFVLHRDDPSIPAGEVVEWLNEHKNAGRIDVFGGSNWHHTRIEAANDYAEKHGLQGFSVSSPNLSLATVNEPMWAECLTLDQEGRDWHQKSGFPIFAWSSGGGGFFAGVASDDVRRVYFNEENSRRKGRAGEVAARHNVTVPQIALAWTLCQPSQPWCLIGPGNVAQLNESLGALDVALSAADLNYLEFGN